jgi:hypothetical protein
VKFKSIFIFFNAVLVIFLAVLCLMPGLILGSDFSSAFWKTNWFFVLVLAVILAGFDAYFFINRKLYSLLEKEDWPALVHYLEDRVIRQGKFSPHLVRLLANTYLVLSDSSSVMSLENKAAIARPALVESNALVFGTARILGRDFNGAAHFFGARVDSAKPGLRQWVRWYYGFSLLLDRQFEAASEELIRLAGNSDDGVVAGLASCFLGETLAASLPERAEHLKTAASAGRDRVLKALPQYKNWIRETAKIRMEIYAAALSKYMEEAGRWLYK